MTEYDPKEIQAVMGTYHQLRHTFGTFGEDINETPNSLVDLLTSLQKIPAELRDDTITQSIAMLEQSAPILDGIYHYAEWQAAANMLLPGFSKYSAPPRVGRTESDTKPYRIILRDLLTWIRAYQNEEMVSISVAMKEFPYLARKTLAEGLDSIQESKPSLCPEGLKTSLDEMVRGNPANLKNYDTTVISTVLEALTNYFGPQLESLENLDALLD